MISYLDRLNSAVLRGVESGDPAVIDRYLRSAAGEPRDDAEVMALATVTSAVYMGWRCGVRS